jgi:hypothetical protein
MNLRWSAIYTRSLSPIKFCDGLLLQNNVFAVCRPNLMPLPVDALDYAHAIRSECYITQPNKISNSAKSGTVKSLR